MDFEVLFGESLKSEVKNNKDFETLKVDIGSEKTYLDGEWEILKKFKKSIRLKKDKSKIHIFFNRVWRLMKDFGFSGLTSHSFLYNDGIFNLVCMDEETVLFIKCYSSDNGICRESISNDIKEIVEKKDSYINYVRSQYSDRKRKYGFLIITDDYALPEQDLLLMETNKILYFNEEVLDYYETLVNHLGRAARYQLLGSIFAGNKIPELDTRIPAIEGRMGRHKYYSFSIEPEKLLKIGFVLHRNNGNRKLMPTYQRLIKKSRLNAIREFVNSNGFFPNSIVINISSGNKPLRFELADKQLENSISKMGILHLPKKYCSAYIIDGQHRLYGYSDSNHTMNNSIPVVAFVNLDRSEQVRLFMEINENQKSVSKNLRNTLNSDLLWDSEDLSKRKKALRLLVAQELGELKDSYLYGRIIIGENNKTPSCSITIDTINTALNSTNFFNQYNKKNELIKKGTMDCGNNNDTHDLFLSFIKDIFKDFALKIPNEWNKEDSDGAIVVTNSGIYSIIRLTSDIVDYLIYKENINLELGVNKENLDKITSYFSIVYEKINELDFDERQNIRKSYGSGGRIKYWRMMQRWVNSKYPDFLPEGMEEYWKDNDMRFNDTAFKMIRDVEMFMNKNIRENLEHHYGSNWFKQGVPKKVYDSSMSLAASKNYEKLDGEEVTAWECLVIINYREIITYKKNWQEIFEEKYTLPNEKKIPGGKDAKTKWIEKFNRIRNENHHTYSVTEEEYEWLSGIHEWLIKNQNISV